MLFSPALLFLILGTSVMATPIPTGGPDGVQSQAETQVSHQHHAESGRSGSDKLEDGLWETGYDTNPSGRKYDSIITYYMAIVDGAAIGVWPNPETKAVKAIFEKSDWSRQTTVNTKFLKKWKPEFPDNMLTPFSQKKHFPEGELKLVPGSITGSIGTWKFASDYTKRDEKEVQIRIEIPGLLTQLAASPPKRQQGTRRGSMGYGV